MIMTSAQIKALNDVVECIEKLERICVLPDTVPDVYKLNLDLTSEKLTETLNRYLCEEKTKVLCKKILDNSIDFKEYLKALSTIHFHNF